MDALRLTQFSKGGGCGCKIAPSVLKEILHNTDSASFRDLLVGNESSDDAAVYKFNDTTGIVSTTDFFQPIVDDPFDFGRIASANAISDIYAMGAKPMMAIAILAWPIAKLPASSAQRVLEGSRQVCREAGIPLAGGHTIDSSDPIFGLSVTGSVELASLKKNIGARLGDYLFLTKRLGVGILSTAMKRDLLEPEHYDILLRQLTRLNNVGYELGKIEGVNAMTDVTGFGLLGHLLEICNGSGLGAEISYNSLPKLESVGSYIAQKTIPGATARNWESYGDQVEIEEGVDGKEAQVLLSDPQTNGGLLISVAEDDVSRVEKVLEESGYGDFLQPIGRMVSRREKVIKVRA